MKGDKTYFNVNDNTESKGYNLILTLQNSKTVHLIYPVFSVYFSGTTGLMDFK